jgi:hypothetical protein
MNGYLGITMMLLATLAASAIITSFVSLLIEIYLYATRKAKVFRRKR